jgi:RimJ/RimL family protein N-acetyltransferase
MIRFAFDQMRLLRIVTITDQQNTSSIHLLQRLGMRLEAAPPSWSGSLMATLDNDRST